MSALVFNWARPCSLRSSRSIAPWRRVSAVAADGTTASGGRDLTADTTLESDFILLELWRHPPENGVWNPPTRPLIDKAVRSILARQLPDGGFNIYAAGPFGNQRDHQGVYGAEAGRTGLRRSQSGSGAGAHSGDGRAAGGQQLRQGQPEPVRSVSTRATRRRFRPKLMLLGKADLRDVLLDARDRDSACRFCTR